MWPHWTEWSASGMSTTFARITRAHSMLTCKWQQKRHGIEWYVICTALKDEWPPSHTPPFGHCWVDYWGVKWIEIGQITTIRKVGTYLIAAVTAGRDVCIQYRHTVHKPRNFRYNSKWKLMVLLRSKVFVFGVHMAWPNQRMPLP